MKGKFLLLSCFIAVNVFAQNDSTGNTNVQNQTNKKKRPDTETAQNFLWAKADQCKNG
jgi:hypothetical protein